jgi:hypothetical protein
MVSAPPSPPTHLDTTNTWDQRAYEERRRQADIYRPPNVNLVTGHALDCACPRCPGWYVERAKLGHPESQTPDRKPNALTDQVVPVAILMAVFTLCAVVLLPVIAPILALTAVSLALVVVSLVVVVIAALAVLGVYVKASRDVTSAAAPKVVRGRVLRRRM